MFAVNPNESFYIDLKQNDIVNARLNFLIVLNVTKLWQNATKAHLYEIVFVIDGDVGHVSLQCKLIIIHVLKVFATSLDVTSGKAFCKFGSSCVKNSQGLSLEVKWIETLIGLIVYSKFNNLITT